MSANQTPTPESVKRAAQAFYGFAEGSLLNMALWDYANGTLDPITHKQLTNIAHSFDRLRSETLEDMIQVVRTYGEECNTNALNSTGSFTCDYLARAAAASEIEGRIRSLNPQQP